MKHKRFWDHSLFKDKESNCQFFEKGFIKLPFLSTKECQELLEQLNEIKGINIGGLFHSRIHCSSDERKPISDIITNFINTKIERLALSTKYKIVGAVFVSKSKSPNAEFGIHTDDSLCDERQFLPFNLWIPLVDVNLENGTLNLFPQTHLKTSLFRGATINDKFTIDIKNNKSYKSEPIIANMGSAIVYHPGTIHFSGNNKSDCNRPAIVLSLIPQTATANIFVTKKYFIFKNKIYKYNIEINDFDFHNWNNKTHPSFEPEEIIKI
jgi:hypothetical protein